MIRVLIADDSPAIRDGLAYLLEGSNEFQLVGTAENGEEAVDLALKFRPDVIVMDGQMPRLDGVEATRQIKESLPGIGILFLSVFTDLMEACVQAGANGFLCKDCSPEELLSALRQIAQNPGSIC
ncbi:MAG: response regulator transcription factor [Dehalococcoidia bacterium]